MTTAKSLSAEQFGAAAARYRISPVHAGGPDLAALAEAVKDYGRPRVIDVGCGAGHAALAVAPFASSVLAVDMTEAMLDQTRSLAAERGAANLETRRADVEALPFADGAFDLTVSRYSVHHWSRPETGLAECLRVSGGRFLVSDILGFADPGVDTFFQAVEMLRDASHIRDYTLADWRAMAGRAGARVRVLGTWPTGQELEDWVARIGTPAPKVEILRTLLAEAGDEVRAALGIADGRFTMTTALLEIVRA